MSRAAPKNTDLVPVKADRLVATAAAKPPFSMSRRGMQAAYERVYAMIDGDTLWAEEARKNILGFLEFGMRLLPKEETGQQVDNKLKNFYEGLKREGTLDLPAEEVPDAGTEVHTEVSEQDGEATS